MFDSTCRKWRREREGRVVATSRQAKPTLAGEDVAPRAHVPQPRNRIHAARCRQRSIALPEGSIHGMSRQPGLIAPRLLAAVHAGMAGAPGLLPAGLPDCHPCRRQGVQPWCWPACLALPSAGIECHAPGRPRHTPPGCAPPAPAGNLPSPRPTGAMSGRSWRCLRGDQKGAGWWMWVRRAGGHLGKGHAGIKHRRASTWQWARKVQKRAHTGTNCTDARLCARSHGVACSIASHLGGGPWGGRQCAPAGQCGPQASAAACPPLTTTWRSSLWRPRPA